MSKICIVGDVIVDVTLKTKDTPLKMRLGGIIHCARALWAMDTKYSLAYFAPKYLKSQIEKYAKEIGNPELIYLGEVQTSPYVMLINEVKEIGDQGYEFLLRNDIAIKYFTPALQNLNNFSHLLLISGSYDLKTVLGYINKGIVIDIDFANNIENLSMIQGDHEYNTIYISTSSQYFLSHYQSVSAFDIKVFFQQFKGLTKRIVLKENRGGSRAFDFDSNKLIEVSAQTQPVVHSVGVGDVYNTVNLVKFQECSFEESLTYSSWIATEYAQTTYVDDFKKMVARILQTSVNELIELKGVSLPWEKRKDIHIYIAAPDFDFVDTSLIDLLEANLKYHNFSPRRPIKENGQMEKEATANRKQELFLKDMALLKQCHILIAVLLYNDPGTLIEIGLFSERGLPTFVYDPNNYATNCMLTQLPTILSNDLDTIMSGIFIEASKLQYDRS